MRTDEEIRHNVGHELKWERRIDERRIGVSVDTYHYPRAHDRQCLAEGHPGMRGSLARL
jgi:hypothetical protein